jgi:hypothetical protein
MFVQAAQTDASHGSSTNPGVIRVGALALAAAVFLAGCGGDDEVTWDPASVGANAGSLVDDFNAHAADVDEPWERSPVLLAGEFLRLDRREASRTSVDAEAPGEGAETAAVTVLLEGLLDDSVAAERFVLALQRDGERWTLTSADWAQRCAPGRGHEEFSTEPCL